MKIDQTTMHVEDPLLTADSAAKYLGISKTTLHKFVREGQLPCVLITADRRFRRSDLNQFAAASIVHGCQE
jgi:excisionase family DNA binding protein